MKNSGKQKRRKRKDLLRQGNIGIHRHTGLFMFF